MELQPDRLWGLDCEWDTEAGYFMACASGPTETLTFWHKLKLIAWLATLTEDDQLALHAGRNDFKTIGMYPKAFVFDTMGLSWLLDENIIGNNRLKDLAPSMLGQVLEDPIVTKTDKEGVTRVYWRDTNTRLADAPKEEVAKYCMEDATAARELAIYMWPILSDREKSWYEKVEQPLDRTLYEMETNGILLDQTRLLQQTLSLREEIVSLEQDMFMLLGYEFNPNSGQQIAKVLFSAEWTDKEYGHIGYYKRCAHGPDALKCKVEGCGGPNRKNGWRTVQRKGLALPVPSARTKGGAIATDAASLGEYEGAHPVVDLLLKRNKMDTILTYIKSYPQFCSEDGRLHGRFNSWGTTTGRFSSSEPNLQNIPRKGEMGAAVRGLFVAPKAKLLVIADQSQVEARLIAAFSKCPPMVQAFLEDIDIHVVNAKLSGTGNRDVGKTLGYAIAYGAGPRRIANMLGVPLWKGEEIIETYYSNIPEVVAWAERVRSFARRNGFVYTLGMRKRRLHDINSDMPKLRFRAERQAISAVVQGSAADITKLWLRNCAGMGPLLQIHDELVFEVADLAQAEEVKETCQTQLTKAVEELGGLIVPIITTPVIANTWGEKAA